MNVVPERMREGMREGMQDQPSINTVAGQTILTDGLA